MGKLPKGKVTLSVYVSPECKEKLECLQQLYFISGKRFSLSEIVEDAVHITYAGAYLSQDSGFWRGFFRLSKLINFGAHDKGLTEIITIIQEKKAATKEILKVELDMPKDFKSTMYEVYCKELPKQLKALPKLINSWMSMK